MPLARILPNIFRCGNGRTAAFVNGDSRTVDANAKSAARNFVDPGEEIRFLLQQQSPPFFLIEEDDRPFGEAFASGCADCCATIGLANRGCIFSQIPIQAPVKENEKSESA